MNHYRILAGSLVLIGCILSTTGKSAAADEAQAANTLTAAEKAAGWQLLFDGQTTAGWRGFKKNTFPTRGWVVEDGWLKKIADGRGGDIITVDQFTDFEFRWEWRIPARANNGVKYFITEERGSAIGHEYQMIDDARQSTPNKGSTASFYNVLPPKKHAPVKLAPGSNSSRLIVRGNHVEHWLNGEKVLAYECGSAEVAAGVAASKFKNVKDFGKKITAHILLTDHGSECSFRNLKLRPLPAP